MEVLHFYFPNSDGRPRLAQLRSEQVRLQARVAIKTARQLQARCSLALAHSRRVLHAGEVIRQHILALRECEAEQATQAMTAPRFGNHILLIEDNPADVTLFRHALAKHALAYDVRVLREGQEVAAFVRQAAAAVPLFLPRLVVVDARIPGMEAEETVTALRTIPAYQPLPLVLFSALAEERGQALSVQCGAVAFVSKPSNLDAYMTAVVTMVRRWGGIGDHQSQLKPSKDE